MNNKSSLFFSFLVIFSVFLVELIGGIVSNSLALLSDAGHMLTDTLALALALFATIFSERPATKEKTYGYYRLEILSALFNGSFLTLIALFIFYQAYQRFLHPVEIKSVIMLSVAAIGVLANILAAAILWNRSRENLNIRGAFLHILSDLLSSVGVVAGGLLIYFKGWYYVDPILGILIGILILRGAVLLIFEATNVLLESVPQGMKLEEIVQTIREIPGVKEIHDLHVWAITSGMNAISAHILIENTKVDRAAEILQEINETLKNKYAIVHSTFQTECESCPQGLVCQIEPREEREHEPSH
ncbi:MAG: cation diffusion facilitator family transporter [Candidatus Margulisiibacteriota bacterium]